MGQRPQKDGINCLTERSAIPKTHMFRQKEGVAEPSIASAMIEGMSPVGSPAREQEEDDARDALGVGYIGTFGASFQ